MKITLLGTGASDGIPGFFSNSDVSRHAREHKGKNIRTRASAIIDGHLQIDIAPDCLHQLTTNDINARDWSGVFFTHTHDDHFAYRELQYALYPFVDDQFCPFTVYGNATAIDTISKAFPEWPMDLVKTKSFECIRHLHYAVTPLHANHMLEEDAHNFIVNDGKHSILYATDTGVFLPETWEFLQSCKVDALVIECTDGIHKTAYYGHLDAREVIEIVGKLKTMGTLASNAPIVTTHHGAAGGLTHDQLVDLFAPHGIDAGYDGWTVDLA